MSWGPSHAPDQVQGLAWALGPKLGQLKHPREGTKIFPLCHPGVLLLKCGLGDGVVGSRQINQDS